MTIVITSSNELFLGVGMNRDIRRKVVCAAVKAGGHLVLGARHFDSIMHTQIALLPAVIGDKAAHGEQGFIDQWGKFMGREEALQVAIEANQLKEPTPHKELFSEDLY